MIVCFQEMPRISKFFGADFDNVVDFLADTHRVRLDRPVMFPSVIGGHCMIQNTELLLKSYDSEFLRLILKSNEKRKEEMKDANIRRESERIKSGVEALETSWLKDDWVNGHAVNKVGLRFEEGVYFFFVFNYVKCF